MENEIARFMLAAAKFEFYLVSKDPRFAHINNDGHVTGINWEKLGSELDLKRPFAEFDFENCSFKIFKTTVPQFLVVKENDKLDWQGDHVDVATWQILLTKSYARLRNNVAHGNKFLLEAPFTFERTQAFLVAGDNLRDFIALELFGDSSW